MSESDSRKVCISNDWQIEAKFLADSILPSLMHQVSLKYEDFSSLNFTEREFRRLITDDIQNNVGKFISIWGNKLQQIIQCIHFGNRGTEIELSYSRHFMVDIIILRQNEELINNSDKAVTVVYQNRLELFLYCESKNGSDWFGSVIKQSMNAHTVLGRNEKNSFKN